MKEQKIYTKEELHSMKVGSLRTIAADLKIKNYTTFPKKELIDRITGAQQSLINAGILKMPEPEPEPELKPEEEFIEPDPVEFEFEFDEKGYIIDEETGEVLEEKSKVEAKSETKDKDASKVEEETSKVEQLGLNLEEEKAEEKKEEALPSEEELQAQRKEAVEKFRREQGYVPPEEKKKRVPIGGSRLTEVLIVAVPIAMLLAIYCGLETIVFVISKLWYGDLAYVPINLVPKIILCVISIGVIEFAKYSQKFDIVVDHYASKLKHKEANDSENEK